MSHLDEGVLHAYLDGELEGSGLRDAEEHLEGCPRCRTRLEEARRLEARVGATLEELEPAGDPEEARWEIRRRWARRRSDARRRSLSAAAALLLFVSAGVASAHPASPVRQWAASAWERVAGTEPADGPAAMESRSEEPGRAGVSTDLSDGRVIVDLGSPPDGAFLTAVLGEGDRASVDVVGEGRFATAPGRLSVEVVSGDVEVSFPVETREGRIRAHDRTLVTYRDGAWDLTGVDPETVEDREVRFRIPGPGSADADQGGAPDEGERP